MLCIVLYIHKLYSCSSINKIKNSNKNEGFRQVEDQQMKTKYKTFESGHCSLYRVENKKNCFKRYVTSAEILII